MSGATSMMAKGPILWPFFLFAFLVMASPLLIMATAMPFLLTPAQFLDSAGTSVSGTPTGPVPAFVPAEIQYQNRTSAYAAVIAWLAARNSVLADTEHLAAIEAAGQRWNVDPLLLLAITGQEQSFVPRKGKWQAVERNPWNVFGSWERWSGGFELSALWAANTVARLSQGCPPGVSVIQWINGFGPDGTRSNPGWGYAGDSNWWRGVSSFYSQLRQIAGGGG
jgi:hypothetical protein